MRKFGCNILAVVQQYDVLKDSEVRGAMIGNSKMFFITSQQSREDAKEIGMALGLSDKTVETINSYPLPELMDPKERFSAFTYIANDKIRRLVGTVKNVASRELLYAASSDNETFDSALPPSVPIRHCYWHHPGIRKVALRQRRIRDGADTMKWLGIATAIGTSELYGRTEHSQRRG